MDNNSIEIQEKSESSLPNWGITISLFVLMTGLINFVYFKEIFLVADFRAGEFELKNFLIYNLGVKALFYPFKFIGVIGLIMFGAFLFKVENVKFLVALKIVVLAELAKYLPEIVKIFWFMFIDYDSLEGYDLMEFNDYLSLNGLLDIAKGQSLYPLLKHLSITQVIYVIAVAQLFKTDSNRNFKYHVRWFGITYGIALVFLGLASLVMF